MTDPAGVSVSQASTTHKLALNRTVLAHERTNLALLLAAAEQRLALREISLLYPVAAGYPPIMRSRARILAALIGLLGVVALLVRFTRL